MPCKVVFCNLSQLYVGIGIRDVPPNISLAESDRQVWEAIFNFGYRLVFTCFQFVCFSLCFL
jgi:hypothetical protein